MLVGWHRLGGQLTAYPVGLLGEDDLAAQLAGGDCGRDPAKAATDDEDIGAKLGRDGLEGLLNLRFRPCGRVGRSLLYAWARRAGGGSSRRLGCWGWPGRVALDARGGQELLPLPIAHRVALQEPHEEPAAAVACSALAVMRVIFTPAYPVSNHRERWTCMCSASNGSEGKDPRGLGQGVEPVGVEVASVALEPLSSHGVVSGLGHRDQPFLLEDGAAAL
jgi:hypothetical protein